MAQIVFEQAETRCGHLALCVIRRDPQRGSLSPFDPWAFPAFHSLSLGHFHRGRYEKAVNAAHKAVQSDPAHNISYMLLAAPLAKLGRLEEAKAAAARRFSRQLAGVGRAPALAASLSEALQVSGLPE
jgi:tetratricopeptide (TPR) repeat protein